MLQYLHRSILTSSEGSQYYESPLLMYQSVHINYGIDGHVQDDCFSLDMN